MGIEDRDVRIALETLNDEFEHLEATIRENDILIEELVQKNEKLEAEIKGYETQIEELEEALAEAYLTDKSR